MQTLRYPRREVTLDYLRALFGGVVFAGAAVAAGPVLVLAVLLGVIAMLFAIYGWRTYLRQHTEVAVDDQSIAVTVLGGMLGRSVVAWRDLSGCRLAYYSTQRDRKGGWMQLTLRGAGRRIKLDSTLEGFDEIVPRAAAAARENHLELDESTARNFAAVGQPIDAAHSGQASMG